MKRKLFFSLLLGFLISLQLTAQVKIGSNATNINSSALFEMESTTNGFLISRMDSAHRVAIVAPAEGLLVYQTDGNKGFYYYNSGIWRLIGASIVGSEIDPVFAGSVAYGITIADINRWNTLYSWGNHVGLYHLISSGLPWTSIISTPTTLSGYGISDAVTITDNQTIEGKKIFDTTFIINAQQGIGTSTPNSKAALDVTSTTRGFLPPRMNANERNAIINPPAGLFIYNTTANSIQFYNGSIWLSSSPEPIASITYTTASFCKTISTPQPVIQTGPMGGYYAASPSGLAINTTTGAITPSMSTSGSYLVSYYVGGIVYAYTNVAIVTQPTAHISYGSVEPTPFGSADNTPHSPTVIGTLGGVYTADAGLDINPSTGIIQSNTTSLGNYNVYYTIAPVGGCDQVVDTTSVSIVDVNISYAGTPYCTTIDTYQLVTQTGGPGTSGGTYSVTPATGLDINPSTGAIKPSTSTPGTYTVRYSIAGVTAQVIITAAPTATISYGDTIFSKIATPKSVILTGTTDGRFSSTPSGLTIDSITGTITPSTSTIGTYTVTYRIEAMSGCSTFETSIQVRIDYNTITYNTHYFCANDANYKTPAITGQGGGYFTSIPNIALNYSFSDQLAFFASGTIIPNQSTPNLYTIKYSLSNQPTTTITITPVPTASIQYAAEGFDTTINTPQLVTMTGTTGGRYSAIPSGLTIDSITGTIMPNTSLVNTYIVTYRVPAMGGCDPIEAKDTIEITAITINYAATHFCSNEGPQTVTLAGPTGGTYTATPSGLTIDSITGTITPGTSTAGMYQVRYSIGPNTVTTVIITQMPTAIINYPGSPFDVAIQGPQAVMLTGTTGGIYTVDSIGLDLDATTGAIIPSSSNLGAYIVTYTIAAANACPEITATTIVKVEHTTISYPDAPFCKSDTSWKNPIQTGSNGGTYHVIGSGTLSLNPTTGAIKPSTSNAGGYLIVYSIGGNLSAMSFITINDQPTATVDYTGNPYFTAETMPQLPIITGTTGGIFSSSPAGLSINTTTGAITPSASPVGTYNIYYTISAVGGCTAHIDTVSVTITDLSIYYSDTVFCKSVSVPQTITRTGPAGGIYTAFPATGLTLNSSTGSIIPSSSTEGIYEVTYTVGALTTSTTVKIITLPTVPEAITGIIAQTSNLTAQTYSIPSVADATIYTWTVPTGWTITAGQGTTSITVTTGSAGQNGDITVTAGNSCGTSAERVLAVTCN